jgi:hypothetical protein
MNIQQEQQFYRDALEEGLLNGKSCYRKVESAIWEMEQETKPGAILRWKVLRIAVPAAALLLAGCAIAAGILLKGKGSRIRFFSGTDQPAIQAQKDDYERHSDSVQDPVFDSSGNQILTLENIAIHKDRVTVFCSQVSDGEEFRIGLSVNGGEEREPVRSEQAETGKEKRLMLSFWVAPEVPENCSLTVRFRRKDQTLIAEKTYRADLAERRGEDLLILSGKTVEIEGTYSEEPEPPYRPFHNHTVTIESVRIGRDGGAITISEKILPQGPYQDESYAAWMEEWTAAKEMFFTEHPGSTDLEWEQYGNDGFLKKNPCPLTQEQIMELWQSYDEENPVSWVPFINFSVTDEDGHSLMPYIPYITGSGGTGLACNEIYFTPLEGMREIRLTPLYYAGETETVRILFDSEGNGLGGDSGKLELVSCTVDEEQRTVTVSYRTPGIRILDSYAEFLLDREGNPIDSDTVSDEVKYEDAVSGTVTTRIRILDPDWDMKQIGGYGQEWSVPYPDRGKAVTIYLEQEFGKE